MPELSNARIDQLPQNSVLKGNYYFPIRNMDNSITERVLVSAIIPSSAMGNFEWITDQPYLDEQVVTWQGEWYQANGAILANVIPGVDASWVLISQSPSGFVFWQAGVYPQDDVFVLKDMSLTSDPNIQMFWLKDTTRPYISSDFDAELAAGDWEQLFVSAAPASSNTIKDMGNYNAATNLLPDTGTAVGSGAGGAISKGDEFTFSAAGTIDGELYPLGTIARAKVNIPGQTLTNWRLY